MIGRKLAEDDLTIPVLYALYTRGSMETSNLKNLLINMLKPTGNNLDPLLNRNDTAIHQIIRNIISHRTNSTNIIRKGLINYDSVTGILSITSAGIKYLDKFNTDSIIKAIK